MAKYRDIIGVEIASLVILAFFVSSCNIEARITKANQLYKDGTYFKAEKQYGKISSQISGKQKSKKADIYFKMAECNRLLSNTKRAEIYYNKAIKLGCMDSVIFLNLAKTQMIEGNYNAALKNFERFLKKNPLHKEALNGLISAENAKKLLKQPSKYIIREATAFNNKKSSNFSPSFTSSDGQSIFFTSNRDVSKKQKASNVTGKLNFDLYTSQKNRADKWEKPRYIKELNTSEDDGVCSFTSDGKTIFFTRSLAEAGKKQSLTIMSASRSGGEWAEPKAVVLFRDSSINTAHPAISPSGDYICFVSDDTMKSLGGKDIYISKKIDGNWSEPENIGAEINTSGNEMFPYIADDETLYFSSDGRQGFGGLDIFMAKKDSTGKWNVENMLAPINSPKDDFGITLEREKKKGFFSSNRGNTKNLDRIYELELPEITYFIEGKITDENHQPLDAIMKMVGNDGSIIKQRVKRNGTYRIKLNKDVDYVMMASNKGYLNSSSKETTKNHSNSKVFTHNFVLPSIAKPVKMDNIFYEIGKWTLTPESENGLNSLVKLLQDNPNITIEVSSHTDSIGSDTYNMELSQKRANAVIEYLIKKGIAKDRLQAKGYGESKPVVIDAFLSKKYNFLKEDVSLTPQFINTLTSEQKDICNQINRRTEFRVLKTTYKLY